MNRTNQLLALLPKNRLKRKNRFCQNSGRIFAFILAVGFCAPAFASTDQVSITSLPAEFRAADEQCKKTLIPPDHQTISFIGCENHVLRAVLYPKMDGMQQIILNDFLRRRMLIADQYDSKQISRADFVSNMTDASKNFQNKINSKQCEGVCLQ